MESFKLIGQKCYKYESFFGQPLYDTIHAKLCEVDETMTTYHGIDNAIPYDILVLI